MKTSSVTRIQVIAALLSAQARLAQARLEGLYAETYCELKIDFCARFQMGFVFSTRWNGDFFTDALPHVEARLPLASSIRTEKGALEPLGEWDVNFNRWLAALG